MLETPTISKSDINILIVDDEVEITKMLQQVLVKQGYSCDTVPTGTAALTFLVHHKIDIIITDIKMPGMSGIELLTIVKQKYDIDVIVMTGFTEDFSYETAINRGASDFVYKPFTNQELCIRLQRVLRERSLFQELQHSHTELKNAYRDTINRLVLAAEYKDEDTAEHIIRMSRYSALLAKKYGLPKKQVQNILYASPMHDIGKMGIPDNILLKTGKLTNEEFDTIKTHTTIGADILSHSHSKILQAGYTIALTHHEKWDGTGYPNGIQGNDIDITGRIAALADVFDVLTSSRPYKDPYPIEVALEIIKEGKGKHFDPDLVDILEEHINEFLEIQHEVNKGEHVPLSEFIWSERDKPTYL